MVQNLNSTNYLVSNTGLIKNENLQQNINKSKQAVSDNFESNSAVQTLGGAKDPNVMRNTLLLIPPLMLADKGVNKLMGGAEKTSILTKIANIGDKISDALHLDKIFSHEKREKISNFIKNNRFTKYFTNTFKAVPKSSMAKSQTMSEKYASELISGLSKLNDVPEVKEVLAEGTKKTLDALRDPETASKLSPKKLIEAADDVLAKGVDHIQKEGLFGGSTSISELKNKLKAAESQIGKSSLGKAMSKGTLKTKDVLTFGGGLISLGFTASAILQAAKATKEAPKGEKLSTFMHVLSEQYIGIILFQPSINLLYKAGGNKYRGMTAEGREALKTLIKNASNNPELTKEGLKIANIQKNLLIKGVDKDKVAALAGKSLDEVKTLAKGLKKEGAKLKFWEKPLKFLGRILNTGLDKIKTKKGPTLKGFAGGFLRFALIMFAIQPFIQKPITKLCHKIFGKPKSYLAKQEAQNAQPQQQAQQLPPAPQVQGPLVNNQNNTVVSPQANTIKKDTNLLNRLTQQPSVNPVKSISQTPIQPNNTNEIPLFNLNDKETKQSRYIPSIDPVVVEDNSKEIDQYVNSIIADTDKTIKKVKKSLK